jgi:hypothetical protein
MRARFRRTCGAAVLLVLGASLAPAQSQEITDPTVEVDRTGTAEGEEVLVRGEGWPKGATLIVELCGHGGLDGSVDCDVPHQRTAGVGAGGTFASALTVGLPPKPCPCVVKATDQGTHISATASIAVAGLATVPITEDSEPVRSIEISSMEVTGGGTIAELFGAGGRRVLELTLVNTGGVAVDAPDLSVAWGTGSRPDGFVDPPETKRLEPGDTQTLTIGLERPPLTIGRQTAVVELHGVGEPVVTRASTTGHPWGLVAIAVVLLQLLLLKLRNRLRRRLRGDAPDDVDEPDDLASLPPGAIAALPRAPDDVIDLRELDDEVVEVPLLLPNGQQRGDGHEPSNGHQPARQAVLDVDAQAVSAAALSAELIVDFADRTDGLRAQIDAERHRSSAALTRAAALSEALTAAVAARVEEAQARADRREAEVQEALVEAEDMLERARVRAGELIDMARRTAGEILAKADLARDAAQRTLADVEREREELVAAARADLERTTEELRERVHGLDEELQSHLTALLSTARMERSAPAPVDELDRRLALAVERALSEV